MYLFFLIIILVKLVNSDTICDDPAYMNLHKNITNGKEQIGDRILDKYGDVNEDLQKKLTTFNNYVKSIDEMIKIAEDTLHNLLKTEEDLDKETNELYPIIQKLKEELNKINITEINTIVDDLNIDKDSLVDVLTKIETIENYLKTLSGTLDQYDESFLYKKIMNIPHSVAEDISFIAKNLNNAPDADCINKVDEDLENLFKELITALNFDDLTDTVSELKTASNDYNVIATKHLMVAGEILKKEKKLGKLEPLADELEGTLSEIKGGLEELKISNLADIDRFIDDNEIEIDQYFDKIGCYSRFLEDCHIKTASDPIVAPECMSDCNITQ